VMARVRTFLESEAGAITVTAPVRPAAVAERPVSPVV